MRPMTRRYFLMTSILLPLSLALPKQAFASTSHIHTLKGLVYLNNQKIDATAQIKSGDIIKVAPEGVLVFTIGNDAYSVRGGTEIQVNTDESNALVVSLRIVTGAILGVFGKRSMTTTIETPLAVIGIRGTAVFADAKGNSVYTCTCYGHTELTTNQLTFNKITKQIKSTHHHPHLVTMNKDGTTIVTEANMENHDDEELRMLEALVGRKPAFDKES